ncbi:MAG: hypothetical protein QNJ22_12065 [Desulfosarcinaceae bacterium]|nr:hypothetical protein [Desulfosarcinaceae bacterium]
MTTREKIIVGVMILTVMYGGYTLFFSREAITVTSVTKDESVADLQKFVIDVAQKLQNTEPSEPELHSLEQAGRNWQKDPFLRSVAALTAELEKSVPVEAPEEKPKPEEKPILRYSGFLQMGAKRMAIINGMEYEEGEMLPAAGYFIRSISPKSVVIGKIGDAKSHVLPLDETR